MALGVGDRVRPVAGGAARWAAAPLRRVLPAANCAAHGPGRACTVSVSVPLTLFTAERQRDVEAGGIADLIDVYVFGFVGAVKGKVEDGPVGGGDLPPDGEDPLVGQLFSEGFRVGWICGRRRGRWRWWCSGWCEG